MKFVTELMLMPKLPVLLMPRLVSDTSRVLVRLTPTPVVLVIRPPVVLSPFTPLPVTVSPPLVPVLFSTMPFAAPLAEMLWNVRSPLPMLVLTTLSAPPGPELMLLLCAPVGSSTVTVPPPVASKPVPPAVVISRPVLAALVLLKLSATFAPLTSKFTPVALPVLSETEWVKVTVVLPVFEDTSIPPPLPPASVTAPLKVFVPPV